MANIRKLRFANYVGNVSTFIGESGDLFFDPTTTTLRIGDGETPGGNSITGGGALPSVLITYADQSLSGNNSIGNISGSAFTPGSADVLFTITSSSTVSAAGVIYYFASGAGTATALAQTGANGVRFMVGSDATDFVAMAFATNAAGTSYSPPVSGVSRTLCLAAGTLMALADGNHKMIEDLTYDDELLVWDFDHGMFAASKPLWLKKATPSPFYNELRFDDDSILRTVGQHRIFNKQSGAFTYPLTDDTPIGTMTFNQYGREIRLIEKSIVEDMTESYNVITDYHMNSFASGVLTSNSLNNLYPIEDMRFIKHNVVIREFPHISDRFYNGLRLAEQSITLSEIENYIHRLTMTDKDFVPIFA